MGGSGGGSAGKVDFPTYMKDIHNFWLQGTGIEAFPISITEAMADAFDTSPFATATAYDPDADIASMFTKADVFENAVQLLGTTDVTTLVGSILSNERLDAEIAAFSDLLDDQIEATVLPRFHAGMRDINAVMSSAFVIGEALIEEGRNHEVAKYATSVRMKAFSEDAIRVIGMYLEFNKVLPALYADLYRIKILAKNDEIEENVNYDEADARWPFEVFLYGGQMLGILGGGTFVPKGRNQAKARLAGTTGGALSGAVGGAYVGSQVGSGGGPVGAVIGAVVGGVAGYLSA